MFRLDEGLVTQINALMSPVPARQAGEVVAVEGEGSERGERGELVGQAGEGVAGEAKDPGGRSR